VPSQPITPNTDTVSDKYLDTVQHVLADTYSDTRHRAVLVADGYGVRVRVHHGHLVIDDGIGDHRRTRQLTRAQRTVRRLVILSRTGNLTLDAIRWLTDTGITLICARHDGILDLVATTAHHRDARLRRAQALATTTDVGVSIARYLITGKLTGHAHNLASLNVDPTIVTDYLPAVDEANSTVEILDVESRAAADYFAAWAGRVHVMFTGKTSRVPDHWRTFTARSTPLSTSRSNRRAVDPVNALLNYAYSLGEAECRRACSTLGLDPALGVLHHDRAHRDSLALDILEPLRPVIEQTILDLVSRRRFGPVDFIETSDGQCRLTETVTHPLTESMTGWGQIVGPVVEHVAATLADSATGKIRTRTPLTNSTRIAAGQPGRRARSVARTVALAGTARVDRHCEHCGRTLTGAARKVCADCRPEQRRRQLADASVTARGDNWRERITSDSARQKRAAGIAANRAETIRWETEHGREPVDRAAYLRDTVPLLADLTTADVARALGVSQSAASRIRTGKLVPHVRHWSQLNELIPDGRM